MVENYKFFISYVKFLFKLILIYLFFAYAPILLDFQPVIPSTLLPESFDGALLANNKLSQAEHLFVNEIIGPESLVVWKGDIYTGTACGEIIRIRNNKYEKIAHLGDEKCSNYWNIEKCGRPLGIRFDSTGLLYVIDAYYGLHSINVTTGQIEKLLSTNELIDGHPMKFLDDLVVVEQPNKKPKIYMTDASKKWDLKYVFYTVAEHDKTGRVIEYDLESRNLNVIIKDLAFPNGLELTDDKKSILVCQFNKRTILKHYIDGEKMGKTEIFVDNLPGEPDNIKRSSHINQETYWVALMTGRNAYNPSLFLEYMPQHPTTLKVLLRLLHFTGTILEASGKIFHFQPLIQLGFNVKTARVLYYIASDYGLAIELNQQGKIVQSLHSPDGKTTLLSEVKEVEEENKRIIYLGSYANNYLGKLVLN